MREESDSICRPETGFFFAHVWISIRCVTSVYCKVRTTDSMMEVENSLPPGTGVEAIHALFPEKYIQGFLSQV